MPNGQKIVIVMPAYKAGHRVVETFNKIPKNIEARVIIVDDASPDATFELASRLPAQVYRNATNLGYGGNLKICLQKAIEANADVVIELHADGQYDPVVLPQAIAAVRPGTGMIIGSRLMKSNRARDYGMPLHKYVMNILLTAGANAILGTHLTEFQSGFRVYTKSFLAQANIEAASNDHLFSLETILQALFHGFTVSEIPVICRYEPGVTQMRIWKGIKYTLEMQWALIRYRLAKLGFADPVFQKRSV